MSAPTVNSQHLPGDFFVAHFLSSTGIYAVIENLVGNGALVSITRTLQETLIACTADDVPFGAKVEGPWAAVYAGGPIPFGLTGVLTSLMSPLPAIGCPVLVVSTYDGDVLMFPRADADRAKAALVSARHLSR